MSNLVHNEKVKLIATFFNNFGIATFVASALAPLFQILYAGQAEAMPKWLVATIIGVGMVAGVMFHFIGAHQLNQLKE